MKKKSGKMFFLQKIANWSRHIVRQTLKLLLYLFARRFFPLFSLSLKFSFFMDFSSLNHAKQSNSYRLLYVFSTCDLCGYLYVVYVNVDAFYGRKTYSLVATMKILSLWTWLENVCYGKKHCCQTNDQKGNDEKEKIRRKR